MAGFTISPLALIKRVVGGESVQSGQRHPSIHVYMDDITTFTPTVACTKRLLDKLHAIITWVRMKMKPSKSKPYPLLEEN